MRILFNSENDSEAHVWETPASFHDIMLYWCGRDLDDFAEILKDPDSNLPGKIRKLTKEEARNFKHNYWDGNCYLGKIHNTWLNLRRKHIYYKMPSASLHYASREYTRSTNKSYYNDRNRR